MRIGIDIDDTLTDTSESFDRVMKKYKVDFSKRYKDLWTESEKKFIFDNYLEEFLLGSTLKENAKEVTDYLVSLGHELIIITARNNNNCKNIEEKTKKFLSKEEIKISQFYFGQFKKSDIARKLKIDLMIDDDLNVYNNMKKEGIECIHFGYDIKNWEDVLEYIKEKEV